MKKLSPRRDFLNKFFLGVSSFLMLPQWARANKNNDSNMQSSDTIIKIKPLGFVWETADPFLFCVHHEDRFPRGNDNLGPAASLEGRHIGQDFIIKDGWRMYHGTSVPGFPGHPHRGFETITVVREGFVDHADSLALPGAMVTGTCSG